MEFFVVVGLIVLAVPILLIVLLVSVANNKNRIRQLELRVNRFQEILQEIQLQVRGLDERHLEAGAPTATTEAVAVDTVAAEADPEEAVEEKPTTRPPIDKTYRPYPSASLRPPDAGAPETPSVDAPEEPVLPSPAPPPAPPIAAKPVVPSPSTAPAKPRQPSAFDRWRKQLKEELAGEGWEAVIGGSWLNKIGSLVTVVGIVLILSWSWANLDPVGRVAMALVLSLALLVCGMVLERRPRYAIVARGFIGTGWAALYVTAYAMHGIPAARIIEDPVWGFVVLLAVAVGMILHSLHYRSEIVTGLAYFVAFATLTLTPLTQYAWFASLPLAATLIYVAYRFSWPHMVLMGLLATYGTFVFRVGGLAASDPLVASWSVGQAILILYWVMFEAFDLFGIAKSGPHRDITTTIFPLNAVAFLGISLLEWSASSPGNLYLFFALAGAAYAASAVLRARLLPASGFPVQTDALNRALMGSYEGAVTIAAALVAVGIWQRYTGLRVGAAWLLEAEVIFLIGLQLRQPFLRWLAGVTLALPVMRLIGVDIFERATLDLFETLVVVWAPLMMLTAAALYLNRWLVGIAKDLDVVLPERAYTYVATGLVAIVLGHEVPVAYLGLALFIFALILFETGLRSRMGELRYQAYGVAGLGAAVLVVCNVLGQIEVVGRPWIALIAMALLAYGMAVRLHRLDGRRPGESDELPLPEAERALALDFTSLVGTVSVASVAWHLLAAEYVPVAWLLLTIPLFETGLRSGLTRIRYQAYSLATLAIAWLLASHILGMGLPERPWLTLIPVTLLAYAGAARLYGLGNKEPAAARGEPLPDLERTQVLDISTVAGTVALAALPWYVLPAPLVAVAWGLLGLLLVEIGYWLPLPSLRAQGHVLAFSAFARTFLANFVGLGATAGISHRILTVVPLIALYYYLSSKLGTEAAGESRDGQKDSSEPAHSRFPTGLDPRTTEALLSRVYLYLPIILAVVLMRFEFGRVSAVVGWAALALVLMFVGVRWDREDLRLQAYALGILVFARSWSTNFYLAGDLFGLPGPLTTGVLVAVSLYACQLVSPRPEAVGPSDSSLTSEGRWGRLDIHSRTFFSLLATFLLTLLLYYEVSGRLLTVAWTLQGTLLLIAGFLIRERSLRLSGLFLLGVCVLKAFIYDFQELDTIYRILSFIVLGLLMLGVSLIYTRYKEQIRRYL